MNCASIIAHNKCNIYQMRAIRLSQFHTGIPSEINIVHQSNWFRFTNGLLLLKWNKLARACIRIRSIWIRWNVLNWLIIAITMMPSKTWNSTIDEHQSNGMLSAFSCGHSAARRQWCTLFTLYFASKIAPILGCFGSQSMIAMPPEMEQLNLKMELVFIS